MSSSTSASDSTSANSTNRAPVVWPLRFKSHNFGARCYDTLECKVIYDDFDHGDDKPSPSSDSRGPDYLKGWNGSYGTVRNFPGPAKVVWRSKDGEAHEALVDIGGLFKDALVRHNVPREEIADLPSGKFDDDPSILLEVNDRTIRIYMMATIPLKKQIEIRGSLYNDHRDDLILVKTYLY